MLRYFTFSISDQEGDAMFEKGEYVIYGHNGICLITDITTPGFSGIDKDKLYYVLEPVGTKGSKIYSPLDNKKVLMRRVMKREEAEQLIDNIPLVETLWIGNEKLREDRYKAVMLTCEPTGWVKIIKTLYQRAQDRLSQGKKITATDERYLKLAEDSLYSEMGFALDRDKEEMPEYIKKRIEQSV